MRIKLALATVALLSAAATMSHAGCMRCDPIMNVTDAPVPAVGGKAPSNDDVRKAIMRAGAALGWKISEEGPGKLTGRLDLRTHTAIVDIPYSPKSYSIVYKSSVNLDAGSDGTIHKNYNGWIKNLAKGIDAQVLIP